MNLGLDQLTDDQWLELLQEVLENGAGRDPIVRQMAQETIVTESEKLDAMKAGMKEAVTLAKAAEIETIRTEVRDSLARDLIDPTVRLCTPDEEQAITVDATLEAKLELVDKAITEMQAGTVGHLRFELVGNHAILQRGAYRAELHSHLDPQELRELGHLMYKVLNK